MLPVTYAIIAKIMRSFVSFENKHTSVHYRLVEFKTTRPVKVPFESRGGSGTIITGTSKGDRRENTFKPASSNPP